MYNNLITHMKFRRLNIIKMLKSNSSTKCTSDSELSQPESDVDVEVKEISETIKLNEHYPSLDRPTIPTRFIIAGIMSLACLVYAIVRGNMSIIILAMTKNAYNASIELPDYGVRYEWSTYQQSLLLGSFFWGNALVCPFAGVFAGRYGARNILGFAFGIVAILLTVSSVAAQILWLSILIRFLIGVAMGAVNPSIQEMIRKWAPPDERGFFFSLLQFTGIGTVLDWSMTGHLIEQYGWNYAFYVVAVIFGIFTVIWFIVVYESPSKHPRITVKEREFILSKVNPAHDKKKRWPPLRSIALSLPFWALLIFDVGNKYGYFFILTSVPRYLSEVHSFNITSTGLWGSLPYLIRVPFSILFGYIGDLLVKRKTMSTNAIRKWFSICSHFIPGCFLIGASFVGDQPATCLAFITCATCFHSAIVITTMSNVHDLAPNFASAICGLTSVVGYSSGYLAPLVVAYFTRDRSTEEEWRKIFFVGAAIFIFTNIIFILFGSGKVQKWNDIPEEPSTLDEDININLKQHMKNRIVEEVIDTEFTKQERSVVQFGIIQSLFPHRKYLTFQPYIIRKFLTLTYNAGLKCQMSTH